MDGRFFAARPALPRRRWLDVMDAARLAADGGAT